MLIPKKNRILVYKYLFNEGVLCAKKDETAPKHGNIEVPNLYVLKLMQSLKSRGYVRENFSWQWHYWYLTNEGIEYLRDYLHLSEEVVPATLRKKQASRPPPGMPGRPERSGDRPGGRGGFDGERRRYDDKKAGAPGEFQPSFRGGREGGYGGDRPSYEDRPGGFGRGRGGGDFSGGYRRDGGERREGGFGRSFGGERRDRDGGGFGGDREGGGGFGRGRGGRGRGAPSPPQ